MSVGKSVPRLDARQKATGQAKFVEDMIPPNALYGAVLHSTIANGFVRSIDVSKALEQPGVVDAVTCFDVPQTVYSTAGHPLSLDPNHQDVQNRLMLSRQVRYYGEEIAAVVATSALAARLALEHIQVEYDQLPPILTPAASIGADTSLHEDTPDNQLARMDFTIDQGEVHWQTAQFEADGPIDQNPALLPAEFHTPAVHACHIEPNSCFAYMEGAVCTVVSCSQMPNTLRRNIAQALGISIGDVRVIKPFIGGGFGNKQDTLYEPLAAFLTRRVGGRCVVMLMSREECFVNSRTRHAMDLSVALRADETGRLVQNAIRINANGGAYAAHRHAVAAYAVTNCFQTYSTAGTQIGRSSTAFTNLPTAAALRGYGIPQLCFAMESRMDDLAREVNMDPLAFRRKNCMPRDFVDPFDRFPVLSHGLNECMDRGAALTHWEETRRAYDTFNRSSATVKKGLGMAMFSYKTGVYPIQIENAACRIVLNEDGSAQVQVGATELGQGSDTVFAQMASEILTIPMERIRTVSVQDSDVSPHDCGAYASRQSYVTGGAVKQAALLLRQKILDHAARMLGTDSAGLTLENNRAVGPAGSLSIGEVAVHALFYNDAVSDTEHLTAEATYTAHSTAFSFGASFVDLEVDMAVGKVKIHRVVALHDSGTILNPKLAEGQVHGGVAMGVGYALGEQLLFDSATGHPLNNNLLDYKFPTSMDVPPIEVEFIETCEPSGPFGNKALAEPPLIPQAAAIRNAILHATGVGMYRLPMNPQNLVHAFLDAGLLSPEKGEGHAHV